MLEHVYVRDIIKNSPLFVACSILLLGPSIIAAQQSATPVQVQANQIPAAVSSGSNTNPLSALNDAISKLQTQPQNIFPSNIFGSNPIPGGSSSSYLEQTQSSSSQVLGSQPVQGQTFQTRMVGIGQSLKDIVDRSPNLMPDLKNFYSQLSSGNAKVSQSQQTSYSSNLPGGIQQDAGISTSGSTNFNPVSGLTSSLLPNTNQNQAAAQDAFNKISSSLGLPPQSG